MSTEFQREDRYIVIKRSDLKKVPVSYRSHLVDPMFSLLAHLPHRECLVIESDWPEYEPTWAAIQARVTGQPAEQSPGKPVGEVVAFGEGLHEIAWAQGKLPRLGAKLYTHADPGEASKWRNEAHRFNLEGERLRSIERSYALREALLEQVKGERDRMIARTCELASELAEAHTLLIEVIHIAEDREQGYADRLHGGVINGKAADALVAMLDRMRVAISASAEPSAPIECAICRDLGDQCMECEEAEFREWADRHFAAADYRKTDAGVFIQEWMRHAYAAWCARGALTCKP